MRIGVLRSFLLVAAATAFMPVGAAAAGPPIDLADLRIKYGYGPAMAGRGFWMGSPTGGEWRVTDGRLGEDRRLTLDVEVRPPAISVPLDSAEPKVVPCGEGEIRFVPLVAPEPSASRSPERGGGGERMGPAPQAPGAWAERWRSRLARHQEASARRVFVSPSSFAKGSERALEVAMEAAREASEARGGAVPAPALADGRGKARAVGTVAHAVLERLDFASAAPEAQLGGLVTGALRDLASEGTQMREEVRSEVLPMLRRFLASGAFAELRRAKVLARELACIFPWEMGPDAPQGGYRAANGGTIDLVCELDGRLLVVDYKTDRVDASQAEGKAEEYRAQGEMYARAVSLATGRHVDAFRALFVRPCVAWDVEVPGARGG